MKSDPKEERRGKQPRKQGRKGSIVDRQQEWIGIPGQYHKPEGLRVARLQWFSRKNAMMLQVRAPQKAQALDRLVQQHAVQEILEDLRVGHSRQEPPRPPPVPGWTRCDRAGICTERHGHRTEDRQM